jgi:alpha-glucuronidase
MNKKASVTIFIVLLWILNLSAEDGHKLWLRSQSTGSVNVVCSKRSATLDIAKQELEQSWQGNSGASLILTVKSDPLIKGDGFKLSPGEIQANTDLGILYGVYELLRRQQTSEPIKEKIMHNFIKLHSSVLYVGCLGSYINKKVWHAECPECYINKKTCGTAFRPCL